MLVSNKIEDNDFVLLLLKHLTSLRLIAKIALIMPWDLAESEGQIYKAFGTVQVCNINQEWSFASSKVYLISTCGQVEFQGEGIVRIRGLYVGQFSCYAYKGPIMSMRLIQKRQQQQASKIDQSVGKTANGDSVLVLGLEPWRSPSPPLLLPPNPLLSF
ncbi:Os02g0266900 [Oryza sativa Japonica Group]|uniref:Os02g0266900 protein n=1 Tax=Oryza sativa subsp. japonica TaxID=39947 RepID=Q0E266_ORYSJ|nr:Os02g0266900 [Oryza sativa Japonica Group]|eukprot:NP_001046508.1 Os02g0266900 [Oryza sativa Japonica Group]